MDAAAASPSVLTTRKSVNKKLNRIFYTIKAPRCCCDTQQAWRQSCVQELLSPRGGDEVIRALYRSRPDGTLKDTCRLRYGRTGDMKRRSLWTRSTRPWCRVDRLDSSVEGKEPWETQKQIHSTVTTGFIPVMSWFVFVLVEKDNQLTEKSKPGRNKSN